MLLSFSKFLLQVIFGIVPSHCPFGFGISPPPPQMQTCVFCSMPKRLFQDCKLLQPAIESLVAKRSSTLEVFEHFRFQILRRKMQVCREEKALKQFRECSSGNNPRKTHNNKFEPVFDLMQGKLLLCEDIKNGVHGQMDMKSFRASRPEYMPLQPKKFKERV